VTPSDRGAAAAPPKRAAVLRLGHGVSGIHRDPDRLARKLAVLLVERAAPGVELDRSRRCACAPLSAASTVRSACASRARCT
jgi:hypothetical protein